MSSWFSGFPIGFGQVKVSPRRRWDSGSRAYASGRGRLKRPPPPSEASSRLRLRFTQVSHTNLWTPQVRSLSLWGFSMVGICLPHYCLPRQVLEYNRCSVNNCGWINHPKSSQLSRSQELGVLASLPPLAQLCLSRKMPGLQGGKLQSDSQLCCCQAL